MRINFSVIFREGTKLAIVHGKDQRANAVTSLKLTQKAVSLRSAGSERREVI